MFTQQSNYMVHHADMLRKASKAQSIPAPDMIEMNAALSTLDSEFENKEAIRLAMKLFAHRTHLTERVSIRYLIRKELAKVKEFI